MKITQDTRAFLFDFDGTLGRSLHHWADAYHQALEKQGITLQRADLLAACFSKRAREVLQAYPFQNTEQFQVDVWDGVRERVPSIEPYPGVLELIKDLHTIGHKLAVVTNSRRGHVLPALDRWGISPFFQAIFSIEDVSHGKPDPEMINKALAHLKISPTHAMMVGDAPPDLTAGGRAAVKTVAFSPQENREFFSEALLRSHAPHHLVASYEELRALVLPPRLVERSLDAV